MIKKFIVNNLFGLYNNFIEFNNEEKLTLLIGPNGCGKTTMLEMLEIVFSNIHGKLFQYDFSSIEIILDHDSIIIEKISCKKAMDNESLFEYEEGHETKKLKYILNGIDTEVVEISPDEPSIMFWCKFRPYLKRLDSTHLIDARNNKVFTKEQLFDLYFDELPPHMFEKYVCTPKKIMCLFNDIHVSLITSNRLFSETYDSSSELRSRLIMRENIHVYSEDLKAELATTLSNYANLSQKLDEAFPKRIIDSLNSGGTKLNTIEINEKLNEIIMLRNKYIESGILEDSDEKYLNVNLDGVDKNVLSILKVYYEDTEEKLKSLSNLSNKVILFLKLVNKKLLNGKRINVNKNAGIQFTQGNGNQLIKLESLSSGEKQQIILLYNLIFNSKANLLLIDEPEISLHVAWQRQFVNDMKEIIELTGHDLLVATHSPQIINDSWELVIDMGDVN